MATARFVESPVRWALPFGGDMTDADVERLLMLSPFRFMDAERFPSATPLRGILRNDTRIRRFSRGDIMIRKGDFGSSAYLVLSGAVRLVESGEDPATITAEKPVGRRGWAGALAQLWANPTEPEVRPSYGRALGQNMGQRIGGDGTQLFIRDPAAVLATAETVELGAGALLGEIGVLTRAPHDNTIFAETDVEALEIRFQGLRDLRRYDPGFREYIDDLYRDRSLAARLRALPLFRDFTRNELGSVIAETRFETYGETAWHVEFHRMHDLSPAEKLQREPVIAAAGEYIDDLIIIGFGFVRLGRVVGGINRTIRFAKNGDLLGLEEIIANWRDGGRRGYPATYRAIGYVDILRIPVAVVEAYLLPRLPETAGGNGGRTARAPDPPEAEAGQDARMDQGLLEFLVEGRYVNGRAAMVIDTEKCVRCDDCVRACATAHGGNPRFVRHGSQHANIQIANACMHCLDAVCLIGCPTGAIHREPTAGRVVIDDQTCIGCATCASSCTYNNIRMVEIRDAYGNQILDRETHKPVVKATKCDLCMDQPGGPACQRACPHDALKRVNLSEVETLAHISADVHQK